MAGDTPPSFSTDTVRVETMQSKEKETRQGASQAERPAILVLGVGNVLLKDEGVGVRMVERLNAKYDVPPNVDIIDGGTQGLKLMGMITAADKLLVIDAVKNKGVPGDLYRFSYDEIPYALRQKNSLHQADLLECLTLAGVMGSLPETVIVGVEPEDISPWGLELSVPVFESLDGMETMVLNELRQWGATLTLREGYDLHAAAQRREWSPERTEKEE